jgi:ribonuclease HII
MKKYINKDNIEAGVDECARGVLFGRIYGATVIYPKEGINDPLELLITDSKKLNSKKRELLFDFITKNVVDYAICWVDAKTVDEKGIQYANYKVFHDSLDKLKIRPTHILVDGKCFNDYKYKNIVIPHTCIIRGDSKYLSIACASILAKVSHDRYIKDLVNQHLDLAKYDLLNNMGYGTKKHIQAISQYGYTDYHRKSYKIKSLHI